MALKLIPLAARYDKHLLLLLTHFITLFFNFIPNPPYLPFLHLFSLSHLFQTFITSFHCSLDTILFPISSAHFPLKRKEKSPPALPSTNTQTRKKHPERRDISQVTYL